MSQKGKFSAPFKSPADKTGTLVTASADRTSTCAKGPEVSYFASPWTEKTTKAVDNGQNTGKSTPIAVVSKKKSVMSEKKIRNQKGKSPVQTPKTPCRTPVFQLYGVKSPYRRQHPTGTTPSRSRYSFISSQASSPGISPARLIKNFSEKIKPKQPEVEESVSCERGNTILPTLSVDLTGQKNDITKSVLPPQTSPELPVVSIKKKKTQIAEDVYDMDLFLEPVRNNVHQKQQKEKQKIKQVLAAIRKMHKEFAAYQQKYESLVNRKATGVVERLPEDKNMSVTSVELLYSCTQSQVSNTQERRKLYSEAEVLPLHALTQGESVITDPMEE